MATRHGSIGPFNPDEEEWTSYTERMEQYFVANEVTDPSKQRGILLSVCGASTYQLVRNLVAPNKPSDRSFAEIVKLVKDHHHPPPSVIVERFNFNSRYQREGETVAQFVAQLRKLSEHCQHDATLDDMLRDRLVCGLRDSKLQRRLLAEPGLTFRKAFELSQGAEVAERSSKELQEGRGSESSTVLTMQQKNCDGPTRRIGATVVEDAT
jgi:hypothetical protein